MTKKVGQNYDKKVGQKLCQKSGTIIMTKKWDKKALRHLMLIDGFQKICKC